MWKNILVPLDGSALSESALTWARKIAEAAKASVKLVHVIEKDAPAAIHDERHLQEAPEAAAYLDDVVRNAFSGTVTVSSHVHEEEITRVAESIAEHAREFGTDLIILSTHGKQGLKQWMFGSMAQQIITVGNIPVLLVPAGREVHAKESSGQRFLIPLDGSPDHEAAINSAIALAGLLKADITLLHVVPTLETRPEKLRFIGRLLPSATREMLEIEEENAAGYLNSVRETVSRALPAAEVRMCVERGDPLLVIEDAAKETASTLLVLGTHGKSGLSAFWAGSMAARICHNTDMPVFLVPAAKTE